MKVVKPSMLSWRKHFFEAAEILSNIWSETVIDGHPVDSQALPLDQAFILPTTDAKWVLNTCTKQGTYCK